MKNSQDNLTHKPAGFEEFQLLYFSNLLNRRKTASAKERGRQHCPKDLSKALLCILGYIIVDGPGFDSYPKE